MPSDGYAAIVLATYGAAGLGLGAIAPRLGLGFLVAFVAVTSSLPWQIGLLNLAYPLAFLLGFLLGALFRWLGGRRDARRHCRSEGMSAVAEAGTSGSVTSQRLLTLAALTAGGMSAATAVSITRGVPLASGFFWSTLPRALEELTIFDAHGLAGSLQAFFIPVAGLGVFAVGLRVLQRRDRRVALLRALAVGATLAVMSPLVQVLFLDPTVRPDKGVTYSIGTVGFFQDPHSYAAFLVLTLAVATGMSIGLRAAGNRALSLAAGMLAGGSFVALVFTNSRTGFVAGLEVILITGVCAWLCRRLQRVEYTGEDRYVVVSALVQRETMRLAAGTAVVVSVVLLLAVSQTAQTAMAGLAAQIDQSRLLETIRTGGVGEPLMTRRLMLWRKGSQIVGKNPLWGVGPQGFREATVELEPDEYDRYAEALGPDRFRYALEEMRVENAHNYYLQIAAEFGLPVLALWLTLVLCAVWRVFNGAIARRDPFDSGVLAGIFGGQIGFLSYCVVSHPLLLAELQAVFWTVTALGVAMAVGDESPGLAPESPRGSPMRRWSRTAIAVYLLATVATICQAFIEGGPESYDAGAHPPHTAPGPGGPTKFRWTRGHSGALLRPVSGNVVAIPLFVETADADTPVQVRIRVRGRAIDDLTISRNGWHELVYFVPAVVGPEVWSRYLRAVDVGGSRPSVWWEFDVNRTFVPAQVSNSADRRELGIGIGDLRWDPEASALAGRLGAYPWETDTNAERFRWIGKRGSFPSSRPPAVGPARGVFRLKASHPDIVSNPATVAVWVGPYLVWSGELSADRWMDVSFVLGPSELQTLSSRASQWVTVVVDRTWSPARSRVSVDARELGVAVTEILWAVDD